MGCTAVREMALAASPAVPATRARAWPAEGKGGPLCRAWGDGRPCARRSWFEDHGLAGKLRAIQTVSCLLQGPCDAGNRALELSGVMESVIALCASEREEEQLVAVEALIHAAGKAKRASFITANGVSLLKDLYKRSDKDSIRIRALVVRRAASPRWHLGVQPQLRACPGQRPGPCLVPEGSGSHQRGEPWAERAPDEARAAPWRGGGRSSRRGRWGVWRTRQPGW